MKSPAGLLRGTRVSNDPQPVQSCKRLHGPSTSPSVTPREHHWMAAKRWMAAMPRRRNGLPRITSDCPAFLGIQQIQRGLVRQMPRRQWKMEANRNLFEAQEARTWFAGTLACNNLTVNPETFRGAGNTRVMTRKMNPGDTGRFLFETKENAPIQNRVTTVPPHETHSDSQPGVAVVRLHLPTERGCCDCLPPLRK